MHIFFTKRSVCRNGCSFKSTLFNYLNNISFKMNHNISIESNRSEYFNKD